MLDDDLDGDVDKATADEVDKDKDSPRLMELARTGLVLNQSYVQQVCTPSRAALLTGR